MPIHDWTKVEDGTFHAFRVGWTAELQKALNGGVLPAGYYALAEQHGGRLIADILTLHAPAHPIPLANDGGGLAVAEVPPQVQRHQRLMSSPRALRRTLAIRHVSGHRIIALLEIVSPANKDRATHVRDFVDKAENALNQGIHLLLVDILPPGPSDPQGMHGAIAERFGDDADELPAGATLTLASYAAGTAPDAFMCHLAVGDHLRDMPLFLSTERYVNVPLEMTYQAAYDGMPKYWRNVLEGKAAP